MLTNQVGALLQKVISLRLWCLGEFPQTTILLLKFHFRLHLSGEEMNPYKTIHVSKRDNYFKSIPFRYTDISQFYWVVQGINVGLPLGRPTYKTSFIAKPVLPYCTKNGISVKVTLANVP